MRIRDEHKIDCPNCYGNRCAQCSYRGWFESKEGREEREAAEDDAADAARERRILGED